MSLERVIPPPLLPNQPIALTSFGLDATTCCTVYKRALALLGSQHQLCLGRLVSVVSLLSSIHVAVPLNMRVLVTLAVVCSAIQVAVADFQKTQYFWGNLQPSCAQVFPSLIVVEQSRDEGCNEQYCVAGSDGAQVSQNCGLQVYQMASGDLPQNSIVAKFFVNDATCGMNVSSTTVTESRIIGLSSVGCYPRSLFAPTTQSTAAFESAMALQIRMGFTGSGGYVYFSCQAGVGPVVQVCDDSDCQVNCRTVRTAMVDNTCTTYQQAYLDDSIPMSIFSRCVGVPYNNSGSLGTLAFQLSSAPSPTMFQQFAIPALVMLAGTLILSGFV
ncbi:uncharacterized protein BJ171DRAFT_601342 [Polychytrium aggregatum]|uniref:uncharacterized protein n=1 Tax=Polychytrium aggregatum TaxID=110093 RepID=UPI0022FECF15|nr:uncharacterized protein BJ171DRAFT_601342 [Polychytrium aggregatum]KAI9201991.1 hypothetical protein BJ171DRAFT_601342 [Polychytrium aggregatum]